MGHTRILEKAQKRMSFIEFIFLLNSTENSYLVCNKTIEKNIKSEKKEFHN